MVRFVVALLMVAVAACVACGKEPSFKVYHAEPQLELSPSVPTMTAAEFEQYAQWRNARQYREAERRHDEYVKERGPLNYVDHNSTSTSDVARMRTDFHQSPNARITSTTGGSSRSDTTRWTQTYRDLNDGGGGAITIINPYCHSYFK